MKILITGGTGFIGGSFIRNFPQHSYSVVTRNPSLAATSFSKDVSVISDLKELNNLNAFDAVINLAGEPIIGRWTDAQKARICDSRFKTTELLVALIKASDKPPGVFLSGSAIGYYGNSGIQSVDESYTTDANDFPSELCATWERIALEAAAASRVVLLRTGVVLGGEGGALKRMLLPFKLCLGGRLGSGTQYMSWIHIQDMVNAIHFLLTCDKDYCKLRNEPQAAGAFNLVAPTPVTNAEFTETLARTLRRPAFLHVPETVLRTLMGESASILLDSQRVLPSRLDRLGFGFEFPTLEQALQDVINKS